MQALEYFRDIERRVKQSILSFFLLWGICKLNVFITHSEGPQFSQFSCSVVSDSLRPHGPQHARLHCRSSTPGAYANSCPLSRWCHPAILSSVVPFSSHLQSFPASGSLQMSQFFESGGQSIGVSASVSVLPMNTQDWSPLEWTGGISLQSKGAISFSGVFSQPRDQTHVSCIGGWILYH